MSAKDDKRQLAAGVVAALAVVAAVQAFLAVGSGGALLQGALVDTDAYLRLTRVRDLLETGRWFDPLLARANPPDGFTPHWTRPLDVLLVIGAVFLGWFLDPAAALHWSGLVVGPVLQVGLVAAGLWAVSPLFRRGGLWLVAVILICQPLVVSSFMVGRPDHHGLLLLLFVLALGCSIRLSLRPDATMAAAWGGAVSALGLWVSVEFLVFIAIDMALLGVAWLLGIRGAARAGQAKSAVLFGLTAVFLGLERGGDMVFEADRLSLSHLVLTGLVAAFWLALRVGEVRKACSTPVGRLVVCGAAGAAVLACLLPLRADLMPMSAVDPLYYENSFVHTQEIRPTVIMTPLSWADTVLRPISYLGTALFALPGLWWLSRRATGAHGRGWLVVAGCLIAYLPLAVLQIRWAGYVEVLLALPYAALLAEWAARLETALRPALLGVVRPLSLAVAAVWVYVPAVIDSKPEQDFAETHAGCPVGDLARALSDPGGLGAVPQRIMAFYDFGPELLYRTPHSVLALPMHRPHGGYADTFRAMTAADPAAAEDILRRAGVDLVVVCANDIEAAYYRQGGAAGMLWQHLVDRSVPDFLREVPLPGDLGRPFRLYSMIPRPVASAGD